jgi:hypothetical protein
MLGKLEWTEHPGPYRWKARKYAVCDYGDGRIVAWFIPRRYEPKRLGDASDFQAGRLLCERHAAAHQEKPNGG